LVGKLTQEISCVLRAQNTGTVVRVRNTVLRRLRTPEGTAYVALIDRFYPPARLRRKP
jgi:hypothetical protein